MKNKNSFVLKGNIFYSESMQQITSTPGGYVVCEDGVAAGVFLELPEKYAGLPLYDYGDKLIIPGLVDMHVHAPQYAFHGTAMDLELLEWLNTQTFPEESKYKDAAYAQRAYGIFVDSLVNGATTRAGIYATLHVPATLLLMDKLEQAGLCTMVGKINMDRNSPDILREDDARQAIADTRKWLQACAERQYERTQPILTPRFIPSCTDELMRELGKVQKETGLPVQSHLNENPSEVAWVQELCPTSTSYSDAYRQFGLFGGEGCPTVMGHCIYMNEEELDLMAEQGVYVAHCPVSNEHLSSGIAPVRTFIERGIPVGLGTDVAGGFSPSVLRSMVDAIQVSKLYWRLVDDSKKPLSVPEAFYMGTKGGGSFFGKVGSFEPGYEFDAVVLDDSYYPSPYTLQPMERLERMIYLSEDRDVSAKYARGIKVK